MRSTMEMITFTSLNAGLHSPEQFEVNRTASKSIKHLCTPLATVVSGYNVPSVIQYNHRIRWTQWIKKFNSRLVYSSKTRWKTDCVPLKVARSPASLLCICQLSRLSPTCQLSCCQRPAAFPLSTSHSFSPFSPFPSATPNAEKTSILSNSI